jgi:hypothetical protein
LAGGTGGAGNSQGNQSNNAAMNLGSLFTVPESNNQYNNQGNSQYSNNQANQGNGAAMDLGSLFTVPGGNNQQSGYNQQPNQAASGHRVAHQLADSLLGMSQTSGY